MSKKSSNFATPFERKAFVSRSRAVVARQAHNLKVGGSIPPSTANRKNLRFYLHISKKSSNFAADLINTMLFVIIKID